MSLGGSCLALMGYCGLCGDTTITSIAKSGDGEMVGDP